MLAEFPQRLYKLGLYMLPVADKLKSPSKFGKYGKPYRIKHKKYRDNPPKKLLMDRWFCPNHRYGYYLHSGQFDVCCIDFDTKQYDYCQEAVDKEYEAFLTKLDGYIIWTEQTTNGGYHIWVKLTNNLKTFRFATDNVIRKHRGEVLCKTGGAVIYPTVGYKLLIDNLDQLEVIPALDSLEPFGIYPTSKNVVTSKAKVTTNDQTSIEMSDLYNRQNYSPNATLSIFECVNKTTQDILTNSVADITDRSDVFTKTIKEIIGWSNFFKDKGYTHNDDVEDLINTVISNLGIEDKADRCIKSLKDIDQLKPSRLNYITEEQLMKELEVKQSPEAIKQTIIRLVKEWETMTDVLDRMELEQRIIKLGSSLFGIKTRKDIEDLSSKLKETNKASDSFKTKTYKELSEDITPEIKWQIDGLIPCGKVVFLASPAKVGKSTVVTDLAKAAVNGDKLLGKFQCKTTSVLWCNGDESNDDTGRRLERINYEDVDDRRIHFSRDFSFDNLDSLTHYIEQNPQIGMLIIDSLSRYTVGKDLTKSGEFYPQLVLFVDWCEKHQIAAIILHHETKPNDNKRGANRLAGNSDLQRPVEGIYRLEETRNGLKLICDGGRNLPKAEWTLERNTNHSDCGYFFQIVGDVIVDQPTKRVVVCDQIVEYLEKQSLINSDSTFTVDDIANALKLNKNTVSKVLSEGLPNIKQGNKKGRCCTYLFSLDTVADPVSH